MEIDEADKKIVDDDQKVGLRDGQEVVDGIVLNRASNEVKFPPPIPKKNTKIKLWLQNGHKDDRQKDRKILEDVDQVNSNMRDDYIN